MEEQWNYGSLFDLEAAGGFGILSTVAATRNISGYSLFDLPWLPLR
jgi:hypothetical protein